MSHADAAGPALHDPVVVDGVKYRIRSFDTGAHTSWLRAANLREHFAPHGTEVVWVDELAWDKIAGVWRVRP